MNIKKGDNVIVLTGADRGKTGKVVLAFPAENKVLVEGINKKKRHERPRRQGQKGQVVEKAYPLHVSNVMLVDSGSKKPTRIGFKFEGDKKIRISKKSGAEI